MNQTEIAESQRWMRELFSGLRELTPETKASRVGIIRGMARGDASARSTIEWALGHIAETMPAEASVFRATYLEGRTARSVGRDLHMDKRTVYRLNRRVLESMLPLLFGLDGIYEETEGL